MIKKIDGIKMSFGYEIPMFYSFAYRETCRDVLVFAIFPLNLIIKLFRNLYFSNASIWDKELRKAYKAGLEEGNSYRLGLKEKIRSAIDARTK